MKQDLEIRPPRSVNEINAAAVLWTTVFTSLAKLSDEDPRRWFKVDTWKADAIKTLHDTNPDQISVLAIDGNTVIGAVTGYKMRSSDSLVYAETTAVLPERRRQGVGKLMLRSFEQICTNRRVKAILFDTNKDPLHGGATAIWEKAHFGQLSIQKIGDIPGYWDGGSQTGVLYKVQLHGVTW